MTTDFHFPASGWVRDLSPESRKEIERRFPNLPIAGIESEAKHYVLLRDAPHPEPSEARSQLQELAHKALELEKAMRPQALGSLATFVEQAAGLQGTPNALVDARRALIATAAALVKARRCIPEGRRRAPRHRLVRALAAILQAAGEPIETRPKGTLCRLVGIVLRDLGEKPSDVRSIVESALGKFGAVKGRSSHERR